MALPEKREEAERLYIKNYMSCSAIASELGVDQGTVYRWKAEATQKAEQKGGDLDWDEKRRMYHISPEEIKAITAECLKEAIFRIRTDPKAMTDSKTADALCKNIRTLLLLDYRGKYMNVAIDLVKEINVWLDRHEPEIKKKLEPCWDEIYDALKNYFTEKKDF